MFLVVRQAGSSDVHHQGEGILFDTKALVSPPAMHVPGISEQLVRRFLRTYSHSTLGLVHCVTNIGYGRCISSERFDAVPRELCHGQRKSDPGLHRRDS